MQTDYICSFLTKWAPILLEDVSLSINRAIHENSKRRSYPFVPVDCGALPDILVESTLLSHEKGHLPGPGKNRRDS